jgi:hypothetical protein
VQYISQFVNKILHINKKKKRMRLPILFKYNICKLGSYMHLFMDIPQPEECADENFKSSLKLKKFVDFKALIG